MKATLPFLVAMLLFLPQWASAEEPATGLGFRQDTEIIPFQDEEICPGTTLLQNDDGSIEYAYAWRFAGVVPPEYGSWAECYDSEFVCGIHFLFTRGSGDPPGQETMDVYVWEAVAEGNPPPGPDPGNVICRLTSVSPWPIAEWPEISTHDIQVCCDTGGSHFVGFWGNWPGLQPGWFIAADENGPGNGCPRTKFAPGIGYPTGWGHPSLSPVFQCRDLGIRESAGLGDCEPTPTANTTWGKIKSLF